MVIIAATAASFPSYLKKKIAQNESPLREIQVYPKEHEPLIYHIILIQCGKPEIGKLDAFIACRNEIFVLYFN
jgi:hypothetical protein